ncbi:MAG: hypothetical protein COX07_03195 [Bacteroidetes bacterium CG23_combo_of_CG06-09_8_20_14_all_32_9]|nr:MAG: hypothetical protein COX07_03195 [Bacteroidetes bacterium CG23_combo_of_CG06-09_8_20_14_all_32_9]
MAGESIECDKCEVIARKIVPSSPQIDDILGRVIKYECSRNSSTENLKELVPKKFKHKFSSNLDLGTILKADSIYIITTQFKRLKLDIINKTGRHKASKGTINEYTFAEIKYPLENVLNSMTHRKALK